VYTLPGLPSTSSFYVLELMWIYDIMTDDIILLAHTSYALQKMLDICNIEITALYLHFNAVKSVVMRVGIAVVLNLISFHQFLNL